MMKLYKINKEISVLRKKQLGLFSDSFGALWYEGKYTSEDLPPKFKEQYDLMEAAIENLSALFERGVKRYAKPYGNE